MFKAVILLQRRTDMSREQFAAWWLGSHADAARRLPGLRAATFNLVAGDGSEPVDGISELWFDDRAAFEAAYATEHGRAVAADSMAHVARRERLLVVEHPLVVAGHGAAGTAAGETRHG
ncbi:MAG TPA: EthD family reductase [Burkholderiaceae bacterium]|nr:EthD family reductase [Burkholderiaceae bacterium]